MGSMRFRNHHAGCCGYNPTRPDGTPWQHLITLHDGSTVHADSAAEIIEELVPGYTSLDADAARAVRVQLAERLAGLSQEARVQLAVRDGVLNPADADDAALIDILRADKAQPVLLELPDAPGEQADWLPETTLVLVATQYAPHTATPRVGGNAVYVDPSDDDALLRSLHDARIYDYWSATR